MSLARVLHETAEQNGIVSRSMKMFAIYDKKSVAYNLPLFFLQKGQAIRAFEDAVNDPQSPFYKHPEDYCLFEIGEWNDITGIVNPLSNPVPVEEALNVKK